MTELLKRAIAQLKTLPTDEQDAIASRLLAEMEDERIWKTKFESTTDEQWDRIAEMVRQEIAIEKNAIALYHNFCTSSTDSESA